MGLTDLSAFSWLRRPRRPRWLTPWQQRALSAEQQEASTRLDLERAMALYHAMREERDAAVKALEAFKVSRQTTVTCGHIPTDMTEIIAPQPPRKARMPRKKRA